MLLAYYFILRNNLFGSFFAGLFVGIAMLIRYPIAILAFPLGLKLVWDVIKQRKAAFRKLLLYVLPAFSLLGTYLYYNFLKFGDAFISLKSGFSSIKTNVGNPIFSLPVEWFYSWSYLIFYIILFNVLLLFLI